MPARRRSSIGAASPDAPTAAAAAAPAAMIPAPVAPTPRGQPNPNVNYAQRFYDYKERYEKAKQARVETKDNLARSAAKQAKLQEELDYLIEAIAEAREAKAQQPASAAASAVRNLAEQPPPPGAAYAGRRKRARSDEEAATEKRVKTE